MKHLLCIVTLALTGCAATVPRFQLDNAPAERPFPGADGPVTIKRDSPQSSYLPDRFLIGYGSGLMGSDSVMVEQDGTVEVVYQDQSDEFKYWKARTRVDPQKARAFLVSAKPATEMGDSYFDDINDGTQGYLCLAGTGHRKDIHFSNVFPAEYRRLYTEAKALVEAVPPGSWSYSRAKNGHDARKRFSRSFLASR